MVLPTRVTFLCCVCSLLCLCGAALASAQTSRPRKGRKSPPPGPQRHGRQILVLNGEWKFRTDPDGVGETGKWESSIPDKVIQFQIPSLWSTVVGPGYTGKAWYWREFDGPADWQGQTVRLRFAGASETADVWLNGQSLGRHIGGVTPFEFYVTKALHIGGKNLLAVRLAGNGKQGAGLWHDVELLAHDEAYIADCFPQGDQFGHLNAALSFLNTSNNAGDATLDAQITAANGKVRDIGKTSLTLHLTPGKNETMLLLSVPSRQVQLWSPETPNLYLLQLSFRQDKDVLDTLEATVGFRTVAFQGGAITINGAATRLAAAAPQFDQLMVIANPDDEQRAREMLHRLKSQGINVVYLEAPPAALLHMADQEGLLVVEGAREKELGAARAGEQEGLIRRDRSHPCIIGWWLGDMAEEQIRPLRQLDPTRFFLLGALNSPRLLAPGQDVSSTVAAPAGLLPH
jgi:beta-galactosidase